MVPASAQSTPSNPAVEPRPAQLDQPGFALDARDLSVAHSPPPLTVGVKTALRRDDSEMATGGRRCPGGAQRSGEGRGARRREIDLKAVRWMMPAPGMKAGREVAVPLSTGALEVLEPARAPSSDSSVVSQSRTGGMLPRNAPECVLRPAGVLQASGVCSSRKSARFQRPHDTRPIRPAANAPAPSGRIVVMHTCVRWRTEYAGTKPEAPPTTAEGLLRTEDRCVRGARGFASRTPGT